MAASKGDYFGLGRLVSLILAIIPITSWLCGIITRIQEGKILQAIVRIFLTFPVIWVLDIVWMILNGKIFRLG